MNFHHNQCIIGSPALHGDKKKYLHELPTIVEEKSACLRYTRRVLVINGGNCTETGQSLKLNKTALYLSIFERF